MGRYGVIVCVSEREREASVSVYILYTRVRNVAGDRTISRPGESLGSGET